jgi:hypothetical protein
VRLSRLGETHAGIVVRVVQAVATRINEACLMLMRNRVAEPVFRARTMLAVMTLCYARKIYGSGEIHRYLTRNAPATQVGRSWPGIEDCRAFRDSNRHLIELSLTLVLRFLARNSNAGLVPICELDLAGEARRRLTIAVCVDTLELVDKPGAGRPR